MSREKKKKKVQVLIVAEDEILLLKLSDKRGGFWQNVTGGVDRDETYKDAAARELFEETGFDSIVYPLDFEFNFTDRFHFEVTEKAFYCQLIKKQEPKISEEHQSYKWHNLNEIEEKNYKFKTNFDAFLKLKEILNESN